MSDCPTCGYPMVWSIERERAWCAVYGSHTPVAAELVQLCMEAPNNTRNAVRRRADRARLRVVA